ncbi:D-glycero-beta-D-manno-heptose 1,7-bisphosphate 7-phosphatase [soil metagenome]
MSGALRPAAFLDRDGTIIVEAGYPSDPEQVALLPGAAGAIADLAGAGYAIIIVTNQSGIARGMYGDVEFRTVQARVEQLLAADGAHVDGVYHCPHHPDHTGPCECRKPGLGMYRQAAAEHGLDLASSVYIGDRLNDVLAALTTGGRAILVSTGYGAAQAAHAPAGVTVVDDLAAAAGLITADSAGKGVDTRPRHQ